LLGCSRKSAAIPHEYAMGVVFSYCRTSSVEDLRKGLVFVSPRYPSMMIDCDRLRTESVDLMRLRDHRIRRRGNLAVRHVEICRILALMAFVQSKLRERLEAWLTRELQSKRRAPLNSGSACVRVRSSPSLYSTGRRIQENNPRSDCSASERSCGDIAVDAGSEILLCVSATAYGLESSRVCARAGLLPAVQALVRECETFTMETRETWRR